MVCFDELVQEKIEEYLWGSKTVRYWCSIQKAYGKAIHPIIENHNTTRKQLFLYYPPDARERYRWHRKKRNLFEFKDECSIRYDTLLGNPPYSYRYILKHNRSEWIYKSYLNVVQR